MGVIADLLFKTPAIFNGRKRETSSETFGINFYATVAQHVPKKGTKTTLEGVLISILVLYFAVQVLSVRCTRIDLNGREVSTAS